MSDFEYQIGSFSGKKREYYCEVVGNIDIILSTSLVYLNLLIQN